MKRILQIIIVLAMMSCHYAFGQTVKQVTSKDDSKSDQSKSLIRAANDLKSGNWLDVATSFFQLAAGDIAGNEHTFSFKANLFALKVKADSTLLIDTNYVKQKFSRNFQFDFALKLDTSYRFNSLNAGFTWAIVNRRDSSVVQFANKFAEDFNFQLETILVDYRATLEDGTGRFKTPEDSMEYVKARNAINKGLDENIFSVSVFPEKFRNKELDALFIKAQKLFDSCIAEVRKRPLVTLSANGNFDKRKGLLNGGSANLVYLQELAFKSKSSLESDVRASFTTKDTLLNSNTVTRNVMNVKGGFNIKCVRNNKSFLEFKPQIEYTQIFHGEAPGEKKRTFSANGELRVRITDDLWIPFTVKYDLKKKNLLGFLNVSLNMNAFKRAN